VADLDRKITELKRARRVAFELRGSTRARDGNVASASAESLVLVSGVRTGESRGAPAPVPRGPAKRRSSDISGTRESAMKEALAPFPLRDQLTGP
jgi:hypothetical protein